MIGVRGSGIGLWMIISGVISGVDTYQGMSCAGRTGDVIDTRRTNDREVLNSLSDVFNGVVDGVLFNAALATGNGSTCGGTGYTGRIAEAVSGRPENVLSRMFRANQAVVGWLGAAVGGGFAGAPTVRTAPPRPLLR